MTPHRHWIQNYTPLTVPVRLADNTIVYSAGVGTVVFNPVINGKAVRPVEFTKVLHVPKLQNNLLAVFYLTCHKGFHIHINDKRINFEHVAQKKVVFCATINPNNSAHLDGSVEEVSEYAQLSATVPLDLASWHFCLAHHNYATVQKMMKEHLATDMEMTLTQKPDPICEPCLAGTMESNLFPLLAIMLKSLLNLSTLTCMDYYQSNPILRLITG
jgi:hypothetical protein